LRYKEKIEEAKDLIKKYNFKLVSNIITL
jgi:hypothetical protein